MYKYVTSVLEGLFFEMTKKKKFWRIKPTAYTSFDGLDRSQGLFFSKLYKIAGCVLWLWLCCCWGCRRKNKNHITSVFPAKVS